jgi:1L-myo-inositol 1-phosphate cytidylyltransferase / CDP-L-myo-inositol myo-inositolphosphotransferase
VSASGALLIALPAGAGSRVSPATPVAGLPLLRRIALAARRGGFSAVRVDGFAAEDAAVLAGTSAGPLVLDALPRPLPRRLVVVGAATVPQAAWLARLRELPVEPEHLHVDDGAVAVIETQDPARVLAALAGAPSMPEAMARLAPMLKVVTRSLPPGGHVVVRDRGDVARAESWLLQSLIKPSEGFMSRHFERRISLALTRRLARTAITPNAMTLISLCVGFTGAALFLVPSLQLPAALLFLAHSIPDGCDGELARLKFMESPRGAALDFWGDNLVHAAVFTCMAVGWSLAAGSAWPLAVGAAAVLSTAIVAVAAYRRDLLARAPDEDAATSSRIVEALAHRDFIYLIVALAAVGKAYWFIPVTAVGAPAFLALLLWSARRTRSA